MSGNNAKSWFRSQIDLFIVAGIAILFAIFGLLVGLADIIYNFLRSFASQPGIDLVITEIVIFLLGLVWIAYRRWKDATKKHSELKRIIEGINPDVLLVVDPQRNITMCNSSIARMFGYGMNEVIGKKTDFLYHDRRVDRSRKGEIYDALEKQGYHLGLAIGRKKNGEANYLEIIKGKMSGQGGAVLLIRDITERELLQKDLKQSIADLELATREMMASQENFQNILKKSSEGFVIVDHLGLVCFVNPAAELILCKNADELLGKPFGYPLNMNRISEISAMRNTGEKIVAEMRVSEIEWEGVKAYLVSLRSHSIYISR